MSGSAAVAGPPPGQVLDLTNWKLTLPYGNTRPGSPEEISQPALSSFQSASNFFVSSEGEQVRFRAHCGGLTTKTSGYPRCELREMTNQGAAKARWSTDDSTRHTMTMTAAITATPEVKKHVVCAQIHDAQDDVLMIRLEGTKLFVERNGLEEVMLERKYQLGTFFDLKIESQSGTLRVWYNGAEKLTWPVSKAGCYFKAGCYTQSNVLKGDQADAYGEVAIVQLKLTHQ